MNKKGFTLIEMVVVLAVIAILAAILTPTVARNIKASKVTRTINETQVIAAAVASLYKDTGYWPYTGANGPAGGVDRVLTNPNTVPTGAESGAGSGAASWGTYGPSKPLYDYLYYNNPDDDTSSGGQNQTGQDYPTSGEYRWRGPYLDTRTIDDAWGRSYVINARYFPGNPRFNDKTRPHRVYVLSAGPDHLWGTAYSDAVTRNTTPDDSIGGDDIGKAIAQTDS
jgi:prepilin-type N-terminal cleavage/methylation domain-containing protein